MSIEEDRDRYLAAMHAMQSGVAMMMNYDLDPTSLKHLRVGVNSALIDSSALVQVLVDKGVITDEEYMASLADYAEHEVARYEEQINERLGGPNSTTKITLQ